MQKKNMFKRFINWIEDTFMTNHKCISCEREIPDNTVFMICEKCAKKLESISGNRCSKCGDKLLITNKCINSCENFHYAFGSNFSLFYYTETASKIVKNLKYGKKKYIANYMANMMSEFSSRFENIDVLLYVPSSKKRIKERGFNQAKIIADLLGEKFNIKVLDLLIKTKETLHQAGGTQKDRIENIKNSFSYDENLASEIAGKKVLIIDDVFTTGSTLNECAKVVEKLKPKQINTLTFAKTKFNLSSDNVIVNNDNLVEI